MNKRKVAGDLIDIEFFKGQGLWMSVVLRPNVAFSMISKFNLFIALGIRDAIQHFSQDEVKVKWPNDIYIDNGKVWFLN